MAILAFDTHKSVKALRRAGFDDAQAEAVTEQIDAAIRENLVTKDDLENAVERLELRIATEVLRSGRRGVGPIEALDFLLGRSPAFLRPLTTGRRGVSYGRPRASLRGEYGRRSLHSRT